MSAGLATATTTIALEPSRFEEVEPAPRRGFVRRHRLLLIALLLTVTYHGGLLLAGSYQRTYDAYVHIFFADHYRRDWFSNWDDRWYTGFSVFSYPPGSHQSIALVSFLVGLRPAFVIVQLAALLNLTVGVYRWSRIWVSDTAAGAAAILLVLSSSIAETVHVFGQLPTTFSLGFLLQSLPFADQWVRRGNRKALFGGIVCTMACTAGHHVTTLFGAVFFLGPVLVAALTAAARQPRSDEPPGHPQRVGWSAVFSLIARRSRRALPATGRAAVYGVLVVVALIFVVLPYWLYSHSDPITQVEIPHASRDNYLVNVNAGLVFWLIPWGTMLLALPYALIRGFSAKTWPLAASLAMLTLLGTGGTTPLPKLILGGAYDILTLDRFTFWATISILPLAGQFVVSAVQGTIRQWLVAQVGRTLAAVFVGIVAVAHLVVTLYAANLTHYRPFQPAAIDMTPITTFLDKDQHSDWRYLTLGFGDQMAWLGANTTAQTVDGDYHSARQLPELTSRPVERLEGSKYSGVPGIGSLQQFLAVPERYNLKYVFSNDDFYSPLLDSSGWTDLGPLPNGIEVWERADVPPLPAEAVSHLAPAWERYMWGIVPPGSLLLATLTLLWFAIGSPGRIPTLPRRLRLVLAWPSRFYTRPLHAADRFLALQAGKVATGPDPVAPTRWLPWPPLVPLVRRRLRRRLDRRRRRRHALIATAVLIVGGVGGAVLVLWPQRPAPTAVVEGYWTDLDFRRFSDAYDRLDPDTRPDFTTYQTELGRDGGLVASYAKLDDVVATVTSQTPGRVVVHTELTFLTSLQSYEVDTDMVLRQHGDTWTIDLPPADATIPPDEFTSRPGVDYLSQGRRSLLSDATSTVDVLDRPELTLRDVRSLKVDGRWVVIGEVTNADVDPADVTVQAELRDPGGTLLAEWDASQVLIHKLRPGQTSPFRIEFQSIAGVGDYGVEADGGVKDAGTGSTGVGGTRGASVNVSPVKSSSANLHGPVEFDPQTITPLVLAPSATVGSVGVYAQAVVTAAAPPSDLQILGAHTVRTPSGGYAIAGQIRNDGTTQAAVPHLLLAYTGADGKLAWVDHAYLAHSVAPQASSPFQVAIADSAPLKDSGIAPGVYAGPVHSPPAALPAPTLTLPAATGFTTVSLWTDSYYRGATADD